MTVKDPQNKKPFDPVQHERDIYHGILKGAYPTVSGVNAALHDIANNMQMSQGSVQDLKREGEPKTTSEELIKELKAQVNLGLFKGAERTTGFIASHVYNDSQLPMMVGNVMDDLKAVPDETYRAVRPDQEPGRTQADIISRIKQEVERPGNSYSLETVSAIGALLADKVRHTEMPADIIDGFPTVPNASVAKKDGLSLPGRR